MWYHYNLNKSLEVDLVDKQSKSLFDDWYKYNNKELSYDLYEEIFETKEYLDFIFFREAEVDSELSEYEILESVEVTDVKYKLLKKEEWFIGFFKNMINKFVSQKEINVNEQRIKQLQLQVSRKEIKDLNINKRYSEEWVIKELTDLEIKDFQKEWVKYSFIWTTSNIKKESVKIPVRKEWVEKEDFIEKYEGKYEIRIEKEYSEKKLKEKIIVDRREVIEQTEYMYIPGVWSMDYNHEEWTVADFKWEFIVKTISWFNVHDEKYFNHEEIKEQLIDIIQDEHWMTQYMRQRDDNVDWFNIESSKLV